MSTNLEKQSEERKARLKELRNLKRKNQSSNDEISTESTESKEPDQSIIKHRNFDPENRSARLGFDNPIEISENETIEIIAEDIKDQAFRSLTDQTSDDKQLSLTNLEPKKVNWDLKRDLESSFQILDSRTDAAINKSIRERIKKASQEIK